VAAGLLVPALLLATALASAALPPQALLPDEATIKRIVRETMLGFAIAVKAQDFTLFHSRMSEQLKGEITAQEMADNFRSFVDQEIDLTRVEAAEPVFSRAPYIDANGWLVVAGTYEIFPHLTDFELTYAHESQSWKLVGIDVQVEPMPGSQPVPGELPGEAEVLRLIEASVLDFANAVNARDFTEFHANCAVSFQRQFSPERFAAAFRQFSDRGIDLTVLRGHEPELSEPPFINDDGLLVAKGRYAVAPYSVPFELKYMFEDPEWKLFGIDLNAMPLADSRAEAEAAREETDFEELANRSMMEFAVAVKAEDFSAFYDGIARMWREQTTKDELTEIFQEFIDKQIDLTVIASFEPSFDSEPNVDENGVLRLEGTYPTQPSVVYFKLSFVFEAGAWRLIGINVQVR
jgi:hypothetical protein